VSLLVEVQNDVENAFLGRREVICKLVDIGSGVTRIQATEAVANHLGVDVSKTYPIVLQHSSGVRYIKGTFYIYEDISDAKRHLSPYLFKRLHPEEEKKADKEPEKKEAKVDVAEKKEAKVDVAEKKEAKE